MADFRVGTAQSGERRGELLRADGQPMRVLVVDDERALAELVAMALRYEGWQTRMALDGQSAYEITAEWQPDSVVLDIMLPDMNGVDVLHRLRACSPQLPVLFLTAKDGTDDRIAGLAAGGDDYVTKPFSVEEVVLRLRSLMRRNALAAGASSSLQVGGLELDEDAREVRRDGGVVALTATEFELLRYLMRNAGRVVSKKEILDRVWAYDFGGQVNVVELYVSYLRKKIDSGREPLIHTVRGAGYVLKST